MTSCGACLRLFYALPADRRFGEEEPKADKVGRERKGEQRGGNVGIGRIVGFCTSFFIILPSPKFPPRYSARSITVYDIMNSKCCCTFLSQMLLFSKNML